MPTEPFQEPLPEILAPAGSRASFLAALAAGADAVYCGLKHFSARMEAKNFTLEELAGLTRLAHERGTRVMVALNTLVKGGETADLGRLIRQLKVHVGVDALICQDLAVVNLARQLEFEGELHLSTLANVSFPAAMSALPQLGVCRVVLPRELGVDEIKAMAAACPRAVELEVFVHGALCYAVSGRCYWSSFLGGKSGLRGRCVQPCRRMYDQKDWKGRMFSCRDLSLDLLAKVLKGIPRIRAWKIEGRKKGPHYVFYTVKAYQMIRDHGKDAAAKKAAVALLESALGRPGTHYHFLPQRPQSPIEDGIQTGSGLFVGAVKGSGANAFFQPRMALLPEDALRVGYEDMPGHQVIRMRRFVPKGARFVLSGSRQRPVAKGTPVFLTDRREKALADEITAMERRLTLPVLPVLATTGDSFSDVTQTFAPEVPARDMVVERQLQPSPIKGETALWLSDRALKGDTGKKRRTIWWWLPPVVWPDTEASLKALIERAVGAGGRRFVLNAPWQQALFRQVGAPVTLWAGPFCNIANGMAIRVLADMGFSGVVVSPELGREDILRLPLESALPLGIVTWGMWPLCIARTVSERLDLGEPFTSPKGESAFTVRHGSDFWTYPNWRLDLTAYHPELVRAGYRLLIQMNETVPRGVEMKKREGVWNWRIGLA